MSRVARSAVRRPTLRPRPRADPGPRARPLARRAIARVRQAAAIERETAAADALRQPCLEPLQLGDPLADPLGPARGQLRPVGALGHAVVRQPVELGPDLL